MQVHNENVNNPPAETASTVRVLLYPDKNIKDEVKQELSDSDNSEPPMTLKNVGGSSIHFATDPVMYVPKQEQEAATNYGKQWHNIIAIITIN